MFRTVPLTIIGSFSLYTQEWYMSYLASRRIFDELLGIREESVILYLRGMDPLA